MLGADVWRRDPFAAWHTKVLTLAANSGRQILALLTVPRVEHAASPGKCSWVKVLGVGNETSHPTTECCRSNFSQFQLNYLVWFLSEGTDLHRLCIWVLLCSHPQPLKSCFPTWQKQDWDSKCCGLHPCTEWTVMSSKALVTPGHSTAHTLLKVSPPGDKWLGRCHIPHRSLQWGVPALWPHQAVDKPTAAHCAPSLLLRGKGNHVSFPSSRDLWFKSI